MSVNIVYFIYLLIIKMSDKLLLTFEVLQQSFANLTSKMKNIDDVTLIMLQKKLDDIDKEINNIIINYDKKNNINLSEEDIERIEVDEKADKIFKAFLPYMMLYNMSNTLIEENDIL